MPWNNTETIQANYDIQPTNLITTNVLKMTLFNISKQLTSTK